MTWVRILFLASRTGTLGKPRQGLCRRRGMHPILFPQYELWIAKERSVCGGRGVTSLAVASGHAPMFFAWRTVSRYRSYRSLYFRFTHFLVTLPYAWLPCCVVCNSLRALSKFPLVHVSLIDIGAAPELCFLSSLPTLLPSYFGFCQSHDFLSLSLSLRVNRGVTIGFPSEEIARQRWLS